MAQRIGQLLVEHGVLTEEQVASVLEEQKRTQRPFGEIAEHRFGVSERAIEDAWAHQYAALTRWIDPTTAQVDPAALSIISRRQAWQFRVLPIGYEGDELTMCTTREHLARALRFSLRHVSTPCFFVLADRENLGQALMQHYPMDGMSAGMTDFSDLTGTRLAG